MGMAIAVTSGVLATLAQEAAHAAPDECCGLLLGDGATIDRTRPAANVHPHPARHFEIDPAALIAAYKAERAGGLHLMGYYHSHPSGAACPSPTDAAERSGDQRIWAIVAGGEISFWRDEREGFVPLVPSIIDG